MINGEKAVLLIYCRTRNKYDVMTIVYGVSVLILAGMAMHQFSIKKAIHALLIPKLDRHTPVMALIPKQ